MSRLKIPPIIGIFTKLIPGIEGGKMGKSIPHKSILLSETIEDIERKIDGVDPSLELDENLLYQISLWFSSNEKLICDLQVSHENKEYDLFKEKSKEFIINLIKNHKQNFQENEKKFNNLVS